MPGKFITFEGIDGCGKSTQLKMLAERLAALGVICLVTREPGSTSIGRQIRQILLDNANQGLVSTAELLLFAADRAQHVREELAPALAAGQIVLCDRYTDATVAYQGYGRQLSLALINELNQIATSGLTPDATLLFDLSVEAGQRRVLQTGLTRGEADRLDNETRDFHERVRQGYLTLAKEQSARYRVIPAEAEPAEVFQHVCAALAPLIPELQIDRV